MKSLDRFDWKAVESSLDREGQAVLSHLFSDAECEALTTLDDGDKAKRFTKPSSLADLRVALYAKLVPIANRWNKAMGIDSRYPAQLHRLLGECRKKGQCRPQSAVIRLGAGQRRPLRQNAEGGCVFPLQVAVLLKQPGTDFTGGELVMTEQRPRMQSRPMVVPMRRGDAAVFAVHVRPMKGSRGFYRVNLRHAVSQVRSGERVALDLAFHDAP